MIFRSVSRTFYYLSDKGKLTLYRRRILNYVFGKWLQTPAEYTEVEKRL